MAKIMVVIFYVSAIIVSLCLGLFILNYFLGSYDYETNVHEISVDFSSISIHDDTDNITFLPSEDGKVKVVCHEKKIDKHSVLTENGTLKISRNNSKKWFQYIDFGLNFKEKSITVYLNESEYSLLFIDSSTGDISISEGFKFDSVEISLSTGDVSCLSSAENVIKIKGSTGSVNLKNASANAIEVSVSTGDVSLSGIDCTKLNLKATSGKIHLSDVNAEKVNVETSTGDITASSVSASNDISLSLTTGKIKLNDLSCANLCAVADTGDIKLTSVISSNNISITTDTGDVTLEECDGSQIHVKTDTGSVKGTLLTPKQFITKTSTGKIKVPDFESGGVCKITTSTGNIEISVKE